MCIIIVMQVCTQMCKILKKIYVTIIHKYVSMIKMVKVVYTYGDASKLQLILGIAGYLHQAG